MSEDALANYVDDRSRKGDAAPEPIDGETRALVGTVMLAEAALGAPSPSDEAERQSRERLVSQIEEARLSRRELHEETSEDNLLNRVKRWVKRIR